MGRYPSKTLQAINRPAALSSAKRRPTPRGLAACLGAKFRDTHANAVSMKRARFIVGFLAISCLLFLITRFVVGGVESNAPQWVRLINFACLLRIGWLLLPSSPRLVDPATMVLAAGSISIICSAVVSTLENDPINTALGATALTLTTASFVAWSLREQLTLVLVCSLAVLGNQFWLGAAGRVESITKATTLLAFFATIFITRNLQRERAKAAGEARRRKVAEQQLKRANLELERRVSERTKQLETTAEELHAFTYSVSHDLRSPLRAINGMTQILEDEYSTRLDDAAMGYIERVKRGADRMDQLIDALLARSRIGQTEIALEPIDLTAIADPLIRDIRADDTSRVLVWVRPAELPAVGDPALVAIVLQHLLSNAWKFTRSCESPRIEMGLCQGPDRSEYFVRDNGPGFPMEHAGKLFENFQRLHDEQYEGTGIGLATIRSIVTRHGGDARIQSSTDGGTTVFFRLATATAAEEPVSQRVRAA